MRQLTSILLLLFCMQSFADHLLGGEITYKYLDGNKYEVNVTLYRDCNGSKLGGTGGGSSNSNHSDLSAAFLRTASQSSCSSPNQNIGTIYLTKLSYENITKICPTDRSACESNPSFNHGIEAHYYRGTVDFENYSSYQSCGFEIYISISDRSNDLNTMVDGANLYNYAYINPWVNPSSSPQFGNQPQFLYKAGDPVYENAGVFASVAQDSLSYSWDQPLKSQNSAIAYKADFSSTKFISPYCPSGDCNPNPNLSIPQGIYLNARNGNMIYTPSQHGDIGTKVLKIEQWHNDNGTWKLVSVIRRDIVIAVVLSQQNNIPRIIADDVYTFCEGENISIQIGAADTDSVQFSVYKALNIADSVSAISQAPYRELVLYGTADSSMVGEHFISINTRDNNCPSIGEANRIIKIVIHPKARINLTVNDLFCGNNEISINSDINGEANLRVFDAQSNQVFEKLNAGSSTLYTNYKAQSLIYSLEFVSDQSCISTETVMVDNLGNSAISPAQLQGKTEYCQGDQTNLSLEQNAYALTEVSWLAKGLVIGTDTPLKVNAFQGKLNYSYTLEYSSLKCELKDSTYLLVNPLPAVSFDDFSSQCHSVGELILSDQNPSPLNGNWKSKDVNIIGNRVDLTLLPNQNSTYRLTYEYTDGITQCTNSVTKVLNVLKSPELITKDVVMCGASNNFRLSNSILEPLHFTPENIGWEVLNHSNAIIGNHPYADIDVQTLGVGSYTIVGTNTGSNGCITTDTSWLRVDQGLQITTNGKTQVCQSTNQFDLNKFLQLNTPGGGWFSMDGSEFLEGQKFTPAKCGTYSLTYTYDAFGCYAQYSFNLEVVCKPDMSFNLPAEACVNSTPIALSANTPGSWSGSGVLNNSFDPSIGLGTHQVILTANNGQCAFTESKEISVIESPSISLSNIPSQLCEGELLEFNYTTDARSSIITNQCGATVNLENGRASYQPQNCDLASKSIELTFEAKSLANCPSDIKSISVAYYPLPKILEPNAVDACFPYQLNEQLTLSDGVSPNIHYSIESVFGSELGTGENISYNFPKAGIYDLVVQINDVTGCNNSLTYKKLYHLHHPPIAAFSFNTEDILSVSDREIQLYNYSSVAEGQIDYTWSYSKGGLNTVFSNEINPILELPLDTGRYLIQLRASSNKGCVDSASEEIIVVPDILIFIPNAFSPNHKGPNENNKFRAVSVNTSEFRIRIYNRFGQKVFETTDINEGWDGNYLGKPSQSGVYIYNIDLKNKAGTSFNYQGTLNLLR